jgi:hypothetical protein
MVEAGHTKKRAGRQQPGSPEEESGTLASYGELRTGEQERSGQSDERDQEQSTRLTADRRTQEAEQTGIANVHRDTRHDRAIDLRIENGNRWYVTQ